MKRAKKVGLLLGVLSLCSGNLAMAAEDARVSVGGTLFKGEDTELRLESEYDLKRMRGKTLELLVDGVSVEFGLKNATESDLKGANNSLIYDAFCEVLDYETSKEEGGPDGVESRMVNLESGGASYERLLKTLRAGSSKAEVVKLRLYDVATPKNKAVVVLVVGGTGADGNLAKWGDEKTEKDPKTSTETSTEDAAEARRKQQAALKLVRERKSEAHNVKISLNKLGKTVGKEVMAAVREINPNSVVSFRFRNSAHEVVYEWQARPEEVRAPKEINMGLLFRDDMATELMKGVLKKRYIVVKMQEYGDLGGKFKICMKVNQEFLSNRIKLYSVNQETGQLELKEQTAKRDKSGMLCFETAFGGTYVIAER